MPEFELQMGDDETMWARFNALDEFTQGYIEAMFFTDSGSKEDEDMEDATVSDLAPETLDQITAECAAFLKKVQEAGLQDVKSKKAEDIASTQSGHDFWFTSQGHGAGYWDGDWPAPADDQLTEIAKTFSEWSPYRGDDGKVYLM